MDGFHLFYDASTGLFRYTDDGDEDSGVEDLPFSLYSCGTYESINNKPETSLGNNCNDADDDDLTYIDDVRDGDYRPHKSAYVSKKVFNSLLDKKLLLQKAFNLLPWKMWFRSVTVCLPDDAIHIVIFASR